MENHTEKRKISPWTDDILKPGGLLTSLAGYIMLTSTRTEYPHCLAAAISIVATLIGQRLQTENGLVTNIYSCIVGQPSAGVVEPLLAAKSILQAVGVNSICKNMTREAELYYILSEPHNHRLLLCQDEMDIFLKGTKSTKGENYLLVKTVLELFSDTGKQQKCFTNEDTIKEVPWHCLNILGTITPEILWKNRFLTESSRKFLSSFLFFECKISRNYRNSQTRKENLTVNVLDACCKLWAINVGDSVIERQDENGNTAFEEKQPVPHVIPFDFHAKNRHKEISEEFKNHQAKHEKEGNIIRSTIYLRCSEHAEKLALIRYASDMASAPSEDIINGEITEKQIDWAWLFIMQCMSNTFDAIKCYGIEKDKIEKHSHTILRLIQKYARTYARTDGTGVKGVDGSVLLRYAHLHKDKFKETINLLLGVHAIKEQQCESPTGKRTITVYCLPKN